MTQVKAHWAIIAFCAAAYAALATALIRKIPMPQSGWKRFLHRLLLDWPASLPAVDMKGLFGLPFNIPYLTLSQAVDEVIGKVLLKAMLPLVFLSTVASGCAPGTDGLRQSCANTDTLLSGGYRFIAPTMHSDLSGLRAQLAAGVPGAADKLAAHEAAYGKTLGILDSATSSMDTVCAAADAIDAGAKRDIPSLLDQLGVIAQKAAQAVADLKGGL